MRYTLFPSSSIALRSWLRIVGIAALTMLSLQCQNITEPDDIVVGEGFAMRVLLRSQTQEPLSAARCDWRIITRTSSGVDSALGDWRPFSLVGDGEFGAVVPVRLSDTEQRVVVKTQYTGNDVGEYALSLPFAGGTTRYDTVRVCGDARVVLELLKSSPPLCCGISRNENMRLQVAVPARTADTAASSIMVVDSLCSETSMTLDLSSLVPNDPALRVLLRRRITGAFQQLPQTVLRGEQFQIVMTYAASAQTAPGVQQYAATVVGRTATNPACVTLQYQVVRDVTVAADCKCPSVNDSTAFCPSDSTATIPLCIGASARLDTLKLPPNFQLVNNADSACSLRITLDGQNIDRDVTVLSFNGSGNYASVTLAPRERLRIGPVFAARATRAGAITARLRYKVGIVDRQGVSKDCGFMSFVYNAQGEGSTCVIDSARSTIFKRVGGRYVVDTLSECVGTSALCANDPTQPTNSRTLVLRNPGRCPVTITNPFVSNRKFDVSSSRTVINPNDTVSYSITFTPRRTDLWPGNRGSAAVPFHTALLTSGCAASPLQLVGRADSCPQSVGLNLRQWALASKYFEGIVIKPARAEKSGDARALGNGAEIFSNLVNATGGTLDGGTYVKTGAAIVEFLPIASNVNIVGKICDAYPPGTFAVLNATSGWQKSLNFRNKDVIAFRKENDENGGNCYLYGIIWIQQIDADGANPGAFIVTMDFCYPM